MGELSQDQRVRLARLLGMLGSTFEGERAAAATAAHRLIITAGTTWEETILAAPSLVTQPQHESRRPKPPPRHEPFDDWRTTASNCLKHPRSLSEWELKFLGGLRRFPRLSPKQRTRLTEIADRVLGRRA